MPAGQIILVALGAVAVARAVIIIGNLSYRMRWLNYLIALVSALGCGRLLVEFQLLPLNVLLASLACSVATLLVYQILRARFGAAEAGV